MKSEAYLKRVRSLPCVVCRFGPPVQAHHVRCILPRQLGKRVGDEWTVPLCPKCHFDLHAFGDEQTWWDLAGINPKDWCERSFEKWNQGKET